MPLPGRRKKTSQGNTLLNTSREYGYPELEYEAKKAILATLQKNLVIAVALAQGGCSVWEKKYALAGTLTVKRRVQLDNGKSVIFEDLLFPDKDPHEFVCVSKTKRGLPPDAQLLTYLINQCMGRPTEQPLDETMANDLELVVQMASGVELDFNEIEQLAKQYEKEQVSLPEPNYGEIKGVS